MSLIELEGVSKIYRLGEVPVPALADVQLAIGEGEFLAVWGPSGSGKTTLLNLLCLIDRPTKGRVRVHGKDAQNLSDAQLSELRSEVLGIVFQSYNLIPVMSALENVMLPLQIRGEGTASARKKAEALLAEVELESFAAHRPDKMSGGQRQRVAIARALVGSPSLVMADEPTANLDSITADLIIDLMGRLNQRKNVTFVFSTHDPRLLQRVKRKIVLADGRIHSDQSQACTS